MCPAFSPLPIAYMPSSSAALLSTRPRCLPPLYMPTMLTLQVMYVMCTLHICTEPTSPLHCRPCGETPNRCSSSFVCSPASFSCLRGPAPDPWARCEKIGNDTTCGTVARCELRQRYGTTQQGTACRCDVDIMLRYPTTWYQCFFAPHDAYALHILSHPGPYNAYTNHMIRLIT